jgi:hypothetical protein
MQSETLVDGYKYNVLLGRKMIRTIKTDILRIGNVYCFTAPEFLGKNYILNNTKFYIDKVANLITWQSWMDIAIAIINVASIVKLELYSGSVTPGATDTGFAAKLPWTKTSLVRLTTASIRSEVPRRLAVLSLGQGRSLLSN